MNELELILSITPVLESLTQQLPFGDLLSLSRTSSRLRCYTHGLAIVDADADLVKGTNVRQGLSLGSKNLDTWERLKRLSLQLCSEKSHKKGGNPSGCRMCAMPICSACIVRASFGKNENTFGNRKRSLCAECWASGNPYPERLRYRRGERAHLNYDRLDICHCTSKEGVLCSTCKKQMLSRASGALSFCAGMNCDKPLSDEEVAGRICLWCNLTLPGYRSKELRRAEYELRCSQAARLRSNVADERIFKRPLHEHERTHPPSFDQQRFDPAAKRRRRSSFSSTKVGSDSEHSDESDETIVGNANVSTSDPFRSLSKPKKCSADE